MWLMAIVFDSTKNISIIMESSIDQSWPITFLFNFTFIPLC